tara:strand:- start:238 stop:1677 length:1440 start_codon:yes stop_codon:yes gene_type:complete
MGRKSLLARIFGSGEKEVVLDASDESIFNQKVSHRHPLVLAAGMSDIVDESNKLRDNTNYSNDFYLFDDMLKLDPELNGAVRAVSLTANNYRVDYSRAKNSKIRDAIRTLTEETLDFDDFLINGMRNMMVYGNDINKYVGTSKLGITELQSLPIAQITILDDRGLNDTTDANNPVIVAERYFLREGEATVEEISADEILHIKTDYRSNWFTDASARVTYGIWGASRFTSLKQAIRAKYNSMNNRISLEDAMTKQYITIDKSAISHIQDPNEQRERLKYIMEQIVATLESLRGDQVPIFPDYVTIQHIDQRTAIPDTTSFLDNVNADIAAVLQVPRTAAGQEKGSTFAASYTANQWSTTAIKRMLSILNQSVRALFSKHLELLKIDHIQSDLPKVVFEPIDEESNLDKMRRANMGFGSGILSLNQTLDIIGLPELGEEGDFRNDNSSPESMGEMPRDGEQVNDKPTNEDEPIGDDVEPSE